MSYTLDHIYKHALNSQWLKLAICIKTEINTQNKLQALVADPKHTQHTKSTFGIVQQCLDASLFACHHLQIYNALFAVHNFNI